MKKIFLILIINFLTNSFLRAQTLLNGGFEFNHVSTDAINTSNSGFDILMDSCKAFGWKGNLDIITSSYYCNSQAFEGDWYIALTGGGSDAFSMNTSTPLIAGNLYTISFYDKFCNLPSTNWQSSLIEIGLSLIDSVFGYSIYTTSSFPTTDWTNRTFSFIAPINGQYITVKLKNGTFYNTWVHVDGFTLNPETVGIGEDIFIKNENIFYPNPANGYIFLRNSNKISSMEIYDICGNFILKKDFKGNEGDVEKIDVTSLKNGIYVILLKINSNERVAKRLIINRN